MRSVWFVGTLAQAGREFQMEPFSNGTPSSAPPQQAPGMTGISPGQWPDQAGQWPDQVQAPDSSGGGGPARPPRGRRSGTPPWIGALVLVGGLAAGLAHGGSQRLDYLLGVSVGAVLASIMIIVLVIRRSRSRRAASMSYGRAPSRGQDNLAPPGYGPPGYGLPGSAAPADGQAGYGLPGYAPARPRAGYRIWLIAAVLGVAGLTGIIVCTALLGHTSGPSPDYNNPSVVAASIKTQVQQRLSDQSGQYYEPGVTVTSVICTPSGTTTDHCAIMLSNGVTATTTAVILDNGGGFRTQ